jgi:hypothetical protein
MRDKILYSYTGIFDTPDEILRAAKKTLEYGFKKYDVHTPYPIHGMNKAMKLPPSKLGYVALVVGLSSALAALLLMFWMSAVDYPIIIGGKPFFSFPAYVPVIFEVTVLSASIATVLTMLFIYFKLPNNAHPLHDTDYMKKVSSDKYGISIQAEDEKFDEEKVKKFLAETGAKEIKAVYFDNEEINHRHRILEPKFILFLLLTAFLTSGVSYFVLNKLLYMPPFDWMMEQEKLNPQAASTVFADGFGMRKPVEGTISREHFPYMFTGQPDAAESNLINPLPFTKPVLEKGQKKYDIFCSPCHGYYGQGDSRLRGHYPNPPSLHSEKIRNWKDGRIFHVIMDGQNVMPSYSSQLTTQEKWAVVNYVRVLQRALNAKESDLK